MARIFSSGYELGSRLNAVEITNFNIGADASATVQSLTARSGTYALKLTSGVTGTGTSVQQAITALGAGRTYYFRAYIRFHSFSTTNPSLTLAFNNTLDTLGTEVLVSSAGVISINKWSDDTQIGASGPTLALDTWYRFEMSHVYDTNTVTAYVDGVQFATGTTDAAAAVGRFEVWAEGTSGFGSAPNVEVYFDDLAANDDQGSFQNTFPGSGKIIHLNPNAAGDVNTFATQTGGTAGAANNFTRVNETPPDDATTFNGSSTLNEHDLFNVDASGIGTNDNVKVVSIGGRFRNSTADTTGAFKFEVEKTSSGTKSQSAAIIPNSTTWRTNTTISTVALTYPIILYQDPDSTNWTQTTLDSMQIGYLNTAAPAVAGSRNDISKVWALVEYVPAAVSPSASISPSASRSPSSSISASVSPSSSTSPSASISPSSSVSPSPSSSLSPSASLSPSTSVSPSPSPAFAPAVSNITAIQQTNSLTITQPVATELVIVD